MGSVDVVFGPAAVRDIKKMGKNAQAAIIKLAESLYDDMRPRGAEKIQGHPQFYRLRQGNFRIIYCPLSDERAVVLVACDRKESYRNIASLDEKLAAAKAKLKAKAAAK